jgi:hypothetical protein
MKTAGSASGSSESGSISQRHRSADPDPDPYQNDMDPQHCFEPFTLSLLFRMDARNLKSSRNYLLFLRSPGSSISYTAEHRERPDSEPV